MQLQVFFHVLLHSTDDTFNVLTEQMQKKFGMSASNDFVEWHVGQSCVGFFSADQMWYRANIVEVEPDRIKVW